MKFTNAVYEDNIRTVQLHVPPRVQGIQNDFRAATPLQQQNLFLEFDDLSEEANNYRAKIIHCNANWTKSQLNNLDFLIEYNEFNLDSYDFSFDTRTPYVHYRLRIPQVKLPGNYLIKVYRDTNENDLVLTRRFIVFDNQFTLELFPDGAGNFAFSRSNQQIDFNIRYDNVEVINPLQTISVTLRQNQRWDNAITSLKPTFVKEAQKVLEYKFFNKENNFLAGNEFRFFDLRSLRFPGQNVKAVNTSTIPAKVFIMKDKPRIYQAYSQYNDFNGNFIISNSDTGNGNVESNYVNAQFTLESSPVGGNIYVFGALTSWQLLPEAQLKYDSLTEVYKTNMLLKQGWYDYQYYVEGDTLTNNFLEGNHFETENEYEVMVYYRPMTLRADLLLGYANITKNTRNNR